MHGVAKASGVRLCAVRSRRACSTGLARDPSNSGHGFSLIFLRTWLHWGKQGMIAFRNAGADVVQGRMWVEVPTEKKRETRGFNRKVKRK